MNSKKPKIAIILLNWNGWQDTIECLDTIFQSDYDNYRVILLDNDSKNDSLNNIRLWSTGNILSNKSVKQNIEIIEVQEGNLSADYCRIEDLLKSKKSNQAILLIKNNKNHGFAKGNNIGIRFALDNCYEKIILLNNDTVIEADTLTKLIEFMDKEKIEVVTPNIYYYDPPGMIWNSGGRLTKFGSRKYFNDDMNIDRQLFNGKHQDVSFITGCALMVDSAVFKRIGILTENFFFGEEDYEFSMRLQKNKIRAACVLDAIIFHKVSRSSAVLLDNKKRSADVIHFLNRYVNLKNHYNRFYWYIWAVLSMVFIVILLKTKRKYTINDLYRFISYIFKYSMKLDRVDENMIIKIKKDFS